MGYERKDTSIATLADWLSTYFHRTVVDRTGLPGRYDIKFQVALPADDTPDERDLAVFRALDDQMGLKLESRKESLDTIVIAQIEPPSVN